MLKDRAATIKARTLRQEESDLMQRLYGYSQGPAFQSDLQSAFELFWNNKQAPAAIPALRPLDMARFFDWYTTDYRTSKDRQRILELFAKDESSNLSSAQLDMVRARQASRLSVYRLLSADDGGQLQLTDVLREGQQSVRDEAWGRVAKPGDLLLTRVIDAGDSPRIETATALLPSEAEEPLKEFAKAHFDRFREERYGASWDDFLSEGSYLLNHYLLSDETKTWQAAIAPPSAYYDGLKVRERMEQAVKERALADQAAKEKEAAEGDEAEEARTSSPIMLPGDVQPPQSSEPADAKRTFAVSPGGVLLPHAPEPEDDEDAPTILLPR